MAPVLYSLTVLLNIILNAMTSENLNKRKISLCITTKTMRHHKINSYKLKLFYLQLPQNTANLWFNTYFFIFSSIKVNQITFIKYTKCRNAC